MASAKSHDAAERKKIDGSSNEIRMMEFETQECGRVGRRQDFFPTLVLSY
jgi:hypothetical protein